MSSPATATKNSPTNSPSIPNASKKVEAEFNEAQTAKSPLEGEALRAALRKQIDYYFSKENLITDRYLISQMNSDNFVPIKTIASFKMITNLTTDYGLIVDVMKECKSVVVDESGTMVKPNLKAQRNTLILRDIPKETTAEEIKEIFDEYSSTIVDVRSELDDFWYVIFEDDDAALNALEAVIGKTFKDVPVKARIKSESTFRAFFNTPSSPTTAAATAPTQVPMYPYTNIYYPPPSQAAPQNWSHRPSNFAGHQYSWEEKENDSNHVPPRYEGRRSGYRGRGRSYGQRGSRNYRPRNSGPHRSEPNRKRRGNNSSNKDHGSSVSDSSVNVPQLNNTQSFPPLPSSDGKKSSGYTEPFTQYSKQEFIEIVKNLKDVKKPDNLPEECQPIIVKCNLELESLKPVPRPTTAADIAKKIPEKADSPPLVSSNGNGKNPSSSSEPKKSPIETVWKPSNNTSIASSGASKDARPSSK